MTTITQPITLKDELVAVVVADRAVLAATVSPGDVPLVERMCLIAMQIADGDRPGPYCDVVAEREARQALRYPRRSGRPRRRATQVRAGARVSPSAQKLTRLLNDHVLLEPSIGHGPST